MSFAITFSGGGFRLCQHSATSKVLLEQFGVPDILLGVSAGAIQVMITALQKDDQVRELVTSPQIIRKVFGRPRQSPFTKKGKIHPLAATRFFKGLISKKPVYFGDHHELANTYKTIISADDYYRSRKISKVGVMAVNLDNGSRRVAWNTETGYEQWLDFVLASSCIPPFMTPINIEGDLYADGGLRDHSPAPWLVENEKVDRLIEVYARPKDLRDSLDQVSSMPIQVLQRMGTITLNEISKSDERITRESGVKDLLQIYQPSILQGTFDADPKRLELAYEQTAYEVEEQIENYLRTNIA